MIRFESVSKVYRSVIPPKPVTALREVSLEFEAGEVMGIAGPNGAGKSTLLSLVLGFLSPTAGSVSVGGIGPRSYAERSGIAYVPEIVAIPTWWRVTGSLERYAVLSGVPRGERASRVEQAIESMGLAEHRGKRIKQLSKGNRQRVGIAQALLSDADVVVFDEPTHGLDPVWTERFRDLVAGLRRPDRCIVIASHNLTELERVSDRVAILDHGALTRIADLRAETGAGEVKHYLLALDREFEGVETHFSGAERLPSAGDEVVWAIDGDLGALNDGLRRLLEEGASVRGFGPRRGRLEAAFMEAVKE